MIKDKEFLYDISDFIIAVILAVALFPVFILTAFLVKADSPGPVFYLQKRYGRNKKEFLIYKFRTMKVGSENGQPIWGQEADPRASKIGKFLRVSHIDELPQLFNVIKGDMSLVGPRPERPYFTELFSAALPSFDRRCDVKPGITGWAQINGLRGDSSIEERLNCDLFYITKRSLFFNFRILLLTFLPKPIKTDPNPPEVVEYNYPLAFSQEEEVAPGNIPLIVPIRNA